MVARYQKSLFGRSKRCLRPFVIQLHSATQLHYDFRLEYGQVMKSWVVPKEPCLDANVNCLAKRVKDHQICAFEGVIPSGFYGAGAVMLWDYGYWIADQDVDRALRAGQLNFRLHGHRLRGNWTLTRWLSRPDDNQENWQLVKAFDAAARPSRDVGILVEHSSSIWSGRTLDEIACHPPLFAAPVSRSQRGRTFGFNKRKSSPKDLWR